MFSNGGLEVSYGLEHLKARHARIAKGVQRLHPLGLTLVIGFNQELYNITTPAASTDMLSSCLIYCRYCSFQQQGFSASEKKVVVPGPGESYSRCHEKGGEVVRQETREARQQAVR